MAACRIPGRPHIRFEGLGTSSTPVGHLVISIFAATDFSEASRTAVRTASRLAASRETSLTVAHFVESAESPPWRNQYEMPEDVESAFLTEAREQLREFVERGLSDDLNRSNLDLLVDLGSATDGVPERLESGNHDLAVLGATGQNPVAEFLLGSTSEEIIRRTERPVLVVPSSAPSGRQSYDRIVAPVDLSECSRRSLEFAASFARRERASLLVLHTHILPTVEATSLSPMVTPRRIQEIEAQREAQFEDFVGEVDLEDLAVRTELVVGTPHTAIVDAAAERNADLIVMGTHGRRGFERFLLGSTAAKVLRRMPCSVSIVSTRESHD